MTQVGDEKQIGQGLIQKTFSYEPLGSLVDIIFNAAGQVVRATVQKKNGGGGGESSSSAPPSSSTPMPVSLPTSE
jgi:hypothetical protein